MDEHESVAPEPKIQRALADTLCAKDRRRRFWAIDFMKPYKPQQVFFAAGATKRERLFRCANQSGTLAMEIAYHATGLCPRDWAGWRIDHAPRILVASETAQLLRDVMQRLLCGQAGVAAAFGTGTLPVDLMEKPSMARGVADSYDTLQVKHVSGAFSTIHFKSFAAGREAFQGLTIDFAGIDEEPIYPVYSEILTRISATNGRLAVVFTPLGQIGDVVRRFDEKSPDRELITMTLYDVANEPHGHMTLEQVEQIKANTPRHEVGTRVYGLPLQGAGAVFDVPEEDIIEDPIVDVPPEWFKIWGIDFGIGHPFAAVLLLIDRDRDIYHVHHVIRRSDEIPILHAVAMKAIAGNIPVAWPADGTNREMGSGRELQVFYREAGLRMLPRPAAWPEGEGHKASTERGYLEMLQRMKTDRFKVARSLKVWFEEFRNLHRAEDGNIVKIRDDALSATRIAVMSARFAAQIPLGPAATFGRRFRPGEGPGGDPNSPENWERRNDFDLWTGEPREHGIRTMRDPRLGPVRGTADIDAFTGEVVEASLAAGMWPTPERRQWEGVTAKGNAPIP
jgi:phage terminase large subunit-like protein